MNGALVCCSLTFSLILHVVDQATDAFAATLFFFEGDVVSSLLTLLLILLPGICIGVAEIKRFCSNDVASLVKAIGYSLFSPLWAIIVHMYSFCDKRYVSTALFFKTMEAFLEAAPQLCLQLGLLFRGGTTASQRMIIDPLTSSDLLLFNRTESSNESLATSLYNEVTVSSLYSTETVPSSTPNGALIIFGRLYDSDVRLYFGWAHILSVLLSFVSLLSSTIAFNELEPNGQSCCDSRTCGKLFFGIPFFFFTLVYRCLGIALLITFLQLWSGVIIFGLFFLNVLTALYIGDNFFRSTVYGVWSILVPAGYNRDPTSHLGYSKVPLSLVDSYPDDVSGVNSIDLTDKDILRSRVRVKYFLTIHVLSSIFILGSSLIFMYILINRCPEVYYPRTILSPFLINYFLLPLLGLSLGLSVLLVRLYYRCDCSGGEIPSGNIIL